MRAPWLDARETSLASGRLALLPLALVSGGWSLGARLHRALYRSGALAATRLPCRVDLGRQPERRGHRQDADRGLAGVAPAAARQPGGAREPRLPARRAATRS